MSNLHRQPRPGKIHRIAALGGFIGINLVVSLCGGLLTATSIEDWYPTLTKPDFNPPGWVFGPMWSTLYLMMAIAAWRVWRRAGWRTGDLSFALYFLQLALNLGWSALFFGLRRPDLALLDCLGLLVLIAVTALTFRRHDYLAALLLAPYAAWVGFACVLNGAIVALN